TWPACAAVVGILAASGYRYRRPPWAVAPCSLIAPTKGLTALTDGLAAPVGGLAMGGLRCRQPACMWPPPMPIGSLPTGTAFVVRTRLGCRRQRGGGAASPHAGLATHGQVATKAPFKGAADCGQGQPEREASGAYKQKHRPRGQQPPTCTVDYDQPAGAAAACGHSRLQRDARKGGQQQGTRKGPPPAASPAASKGDGASHRGGRPLARRLPTGKGNRRLRMGSDGDDDTKGEEGLGHPLEKRTILPL
ncbi:hypothetical protein GW17_00052513, partial [Ensete ventricosum]